MTDWINEVVNIVKETFSANPQCTSQLEQKLRSHNFDIPFASQPTESQTVKLRRISERRNSSPGVKTDAPRPTKRRHTPMLSPSMPVLRQKRYTTTPQPTTSKRDFRNVSESTSPPPKKRKRTLSSILRAQQTRSEQEQKEREHQERLRKQKERRAAMEHKRKLQKRNSKPSWEPIVPVLRRKKSSKTRSSSNEDHERRTRVRKVGKRSKPKPYKKPCITTIDISDYENSSDDEDTYGRKTADWAKNIKSQVAKQRSINPEEVFGRITEPSFHVISKVFFSPNPNNAKLGRGPTPTRPLQLSQEEIESYDRHMGFA